MFEDKERQPGSALSLRAVKLWKSIGFDGNTVLAALSTESKVIFYELFN